MNNFLHSRLSPTYLFSCLYIALFNFDSSAISHAASRPQRLAAEGPVIAVSRFKITSVADYSLPLQEAIIQLTGLSFNNGKPLPVEIRNVADMTDSVSVPETYSALLEMQPEAYWANISQNGIQIISSDSAGARLAIRYIQHMAVQNRGSIKTGSLLNYPDHRIRAVHFVLRGINTSAAKRIIDMAESARMNMVIIALADGVRFNSNAVPPRSDALSKEELLDLVQYARRKGLEVVPEVKLLTHQEKFFSDAHRELMFNKVTYDPENSATYALVFTYLEEVLALIRPARVHIGHDEVQGLTKFSKRKWLNPHEQALPPTLFLADVMTIFEYLDAKGVQTWMWGDMLLAPDEFPSMGAKAMHGREGYAALRDKIPPEIVVCDWHYDNGRVDYLSAAAFSKRNQVLGATWRDPATISSFSQYMKSINSNGLGMIATTWFYVQQGNWNVVKEIIDLSGEQFWGYQEPHMFGGI